MASLNLDALKKKVSDTPDSVIPNMDTPATTGLTVPSGMPKISLMKLKESSFFQQTDSMPTSAWTDATANIIQEIEAISLETPIIEAPDSLVIEDTEVIEQSSSESIFSAEAQVENQSASISPSVEIKAVETKEFFPSLNLMEDFSISDELLGIEDMSVKTETVAPVVVEEVAVQTEEVAEAPSMIIEEIAQEVAVVTEELPSVISEEIGHVEEVKNELSEQRKWGFRFFANKKVSVLAWVGIITTFSLIGLFGAGFFSSAVPTGKSNIQEAVQSPIPEEVMQPTPGVTPEVVETVPEVVQPVPVVAEPTPETVQATPEVVESIPTTTTYEAGRDYTVIKNTKKNLKKQ